MGEVEVVSSREVPLGGPRAMTVRRTLPQRARSAVHESDRTLWRHRDYVRARMGVVYEPAEARAVAEEAIRRAVTTKDNPADLINVALEELVRARCELPGFTTLDKMVAAIRTETNTELFALSRCGWTLRTGDGSRGCCGWIRRPSAASTPVAGPAPSTAARRT